MVTPLGQVAASVRAGRLRRTHRVGLSLFPRRMLVVRMTYDRAGWHYGGDYPEGLPPENGATHIGMFLGWAIKRGLVGDIHKEHSAEALALVRDGARSGRDFLMDQCDEKFTEEDLTEEGNRFAKAYYEARYYGDYETCVGRAFPSLYHVPDSPANRARIEALLDQRFAAWRARESKMQRLPATRKPGSESRPWWRFW